MTQDKGIWTKVSSNERSALQLLCVKRTVSSGQKVTVRSLLHGLIRLELLTAIRNGEFDPEELEMTLDDFQ